MASAAIRAAIGWLRFALPLFPDAAHASGPALSLLGIVALAYASLLALVQKELKRLIAEQKARIEQLMRALRDARGD